MPDAAAQVQKLLRQQAAIARFGSFALRERDLDRILDEAVRVCAEGLSVPFSKMCRYREERTIFSSSPAMAGRMASSVTWCRAPI